MQVLRTIGWVLLVCAILIFSFYNWRPVEVMIWENMVLETKVPVLVVVAFLIGFAPLLAYHLSVKWSLKRRVRNLENSLKTLATTHRNDTEGQGAPVTPAPANVSAEGMAEANADNSTKPATSISGAGGMG